MNQARVRRNWLVDSLHRCPLTRGDAVGPAVLLAEGVDPVGEGGQVVVGLLGALSAGGVRAQVVPGSGDRREQVGVPAGLQPFQDLDGAFDGFADDPGRGDAGGVVFAFEGQAGELAAVDAAVLGPAHAQAAGPQVLDLAVPHPGQVGNRHPRGCLRQPGKMPGFRVGDLGDPGLPA